MAVSENIKVIRLQRNLTQKELGELMHVSDKTISSWESGRSLPDIETIKHLADILKVRYEVLVDGETRLQRKLSSIKKFWIENNVICTTITILLIFYLLLVLGNPVISFFVGYGVITIYLCYLTYKESFWFVIPALLSFMVIVEQGYMYFVGGVDLDWFIMIILGVTLLLLVAHLVISIYKTIKHKRFYLMGLISTTLHTSVLIILFMGFRVSNGTAGGQVKRLDHYLIYSLLVVMLLGLNRIKLTDNTK